jgi:hypothetical protein
MDNPWAFGPLDGGLVVIYSNRLWTGEKRRSKIGLLMMVARR